MNIVRVVEMTPVNCEGTEKVQISNKAVESFEKSNFLLPYVLY